MRVKRPDWLWEDGHPFGMPASTKDKRVKQLREYIQHLERRLEESEGEVERLALEHLDEEDMDELWE